MLTIINKGDLRRSNRARTGRPAVLIVKLDAIGDFVLFTSVLPLLRRLYDDAWLTLLVQRRVAPLVELCPFIDEVLTVDLEAYANDGRVQQTLFNELRAHKFDAVINAMYTRTTEADELVAHARAPIRIGFQCLDTDGGLGKRAAAEALYTHIVPSDAEWKDELTRYEILLKFLGAGSPITLSPQVWLRNEDIDRGKNLLDEAGLDTGRPFLAVFAGAGQSLKEWQAEKLAAVAGSLAKSSGSQIVLLGGKNDERINIAVAGQLKKMNAAHFNLGGKTTLPELASVLYHARMYIGSDTGAMHIAAAVGTPVAAIFGGGYGFRFHPVGENISLVYNEMDCYYCHWFCKYGVFRCIGEISVEQMLNTATKLLQSTATLARPRPGTYADAESRSERRDEDGLKRINEFRMQANARSLFQRTSGLCKRSVVLAAMFARRKLKPYIKRNVS